MSVVATERRGSEQGTVGSHIQACDKSLIKVMILEKHWMEILNLPQYIYRALNNSKNTNKSKVACMCKSGKKTLALRYYCHLNEWTLLII